MTEGPIQHRAHPRRPKARADQYAEMVLAMVRQAEAHGDNARAALLLTRTGLFTLGRERLSTTEGQHAERIAITRAQAYSLRRLGGSTLYVSSLPCNDCYSLAAENGVTAIVLVSTRETAAQRLWRALSPRRRATTSLSHLAVDFPGDPT